MVEKTLQTKPKSPEDVMEEKMTVEYMIGEEKIKLTPNIVKEYIIGNKEAKITNQEFKMFSSLCRARKLNPFLREAYCIKYSDNSPATIVVGKDAILKRATLHPQFDGFRSGVIVKTAEGEIVNRQGCFKLDSDELVGAWCEVFRKDWKNSIFVSCAFSEIYQPKNPTWQKQPCVMSEKTAMVRALRTAFVEELAGMYDSAEMDTTPPTKSTGFTVDDVKEIPISEENIVEVVENQEQNNRLSLEDL